MNKGKDQHLGVGLFLCLDQNRLKMAMLSVSFEAITMQYSTPPRVSKLLNY